MAALTQAEPGYGADVLRLWVSSVDYTGDVMIGPQIIRQMSEIYRKLRGTLRYLLSNLHDFKVDAANSNIILLFVAFVFMKRSISVTMSCLLTRVIGIVQPEENNVAYEDLPRLDKYALFQLASVMDGIEDSYNKYQFYRFFQVSKFGLPFEFGCSCGAPIS